MSRNWQSPFIVCYLGTIFVEGDGRYDRRQGRYDRAWRVFEEEMAIEVVPSKNSGLYLRWVIDHRGYLFNVSRKLAAPRRSVPEIARLIPKRDRYEFSGAETITVGELKAKLKGLKEPADEAKLISMLIIRLSQFTNEITVDEKMLRPFFGG